MEEKKYNNNYKGGKGTPKAFEYTSKATREKKTLTIKLGLKNGRATLYIQDSGMKILNEAGIFLKVEDMR